MYTVLKRTCASKSDDISRLAGCSPVFLQDHLESFIPPQMKLCDFNVDHVFPLVAFDMHSDKQQRMSCHYTNLQPLTSEENKDKGNKLPTKAMADRVEQWAWPKGVKYEDLPDIYEGWATPLRMH